MGIEEDASLKEGKPLQVFWDGNISCKVFSLYVENSGVKLEGIPKRVARTEEEIKNMNARQYLDEMIVPVLNKALLKVNKEVRKITISTFQDKQTFILIF